MSDLELALQLADAADGITLSRFQAVDLQVRTKSDHTPVTDADTTAEDALRRELRSARPGDAVHGEERADEGEPGAERVWLVDPIDGTKNYARGMPVWATLVALVVAGRPVVGVASAPALGRRWWASAGEGAWTAATGASPRRMAVSGVTQLDQAYLSTTDLATFLDQATIENYLALARRCRVTRAFGDFWQHCLVADGQIDIAVDGEANAWDLAAVEVIVTEAGGRFTDLEGKITHDGGSGLSSNGHLHDIALALLSSID
ncbi:MAG: histidinol-phosphatase [Pseudonocardia sp.]